MAKKLTNLKDILNETDKKNFKEFQKKYNKAADFVYTKDEEGFVTKKPKSELLPNEVIITKEEWEKESGEKYYKETYGRGGRREGAGRRPKTGIVLKFQIRVSEKEKEFINYARLHNLNYDELMRG